MSKQKEIRLGFVDLEGDAYPDAAKTYQLKSASDISLSVIPYPENSMEKRLDLTLISLFIEDLPDFTRNNEGLLKIDINTRNPQNTNDRKEISSAVEFEVKDKNYAPGIDNRGVFRNIILREFVNLGLKLVEIDSDLSETYNKVKGIVNGVEGLETLDVLNGIPYLDVATGLVDGIINVFGKNEDDVVWSNLPALDVEPGPGAAFLRTGIYVAYQTKNESEGKEINHSDLVYRDGKIEVKDGIEIEGGISNCLAFSVRLRPYSK
ncbi:MAG: hypothetical protein GY797_06275 [Deltaproteobacteria bacterium]|nr:hypothetical protein [Deltaproteobacteria bacterium]